MTTVKERNIRDWAREAINTIQAEATRQGQTNLVKLKLPGFRYVDMYLKDESAHASGSLKHRLAQSLFLWGICSGKIGPHTTIIECSSGSTAISEAYFANLLSLDFKAIVPKRTAQRKIREIEFYGGECVLVEPHEIYEIAAKQACETDCYFMDQFTYAERATDWRGPNNIAAAIFEQMKSERCPEPDWIVVGAGTGGTSTTIGRYLRYSGRGRNSRLCVVDPENSVLYDHYKTRKTNLVSAHSSRIEGIGRPRVEPSFFPELVDEMIQVPDAGSMAALRYLEGLTGRQLGGSTGTNFFGAYQLALELEDRKEPASIVSLICDDGQRYADTYHNEDWVRAQGLDPSEYERLFRH
nr:pyridoxal-phosphate dependent enzyme [Henriciella litoralis]